MEFNELSYFQFNNLLHARVVFNLVMIGVDLKENYAGLELMHISQWEILIKESSAKEMLSDIKKSLAERQMDLTAPILLICKDGKISKDLTKNLIREGYKNSFVVSGGLDGLKNSALGL